jgi:hypothetical protein
MNLLWLSFQHTCSHDISFKLRLVCQCPTCTLEQTYVNTGLVELCEWIIGISVNCFPVSQVAGSGQVCFCQQLFVGTVCHAMSTSIRR